MNRRTSKQNHLSHSYGFTMIEAVISMVVVSMMLVAALHTLGGAAKNRTMQLQLQKGPSLAHGIMAEILQAAYEDPDGDPEWGVEKDEQKHDREAFDDVDDYDGWYSKDVQNKHGKLLPHSDGWGRQVTVVFADTADPTQTSGTETGLKRITVTVADASGRETTLVALRSQNGAYDQKPSTDTTIVSAVDVQLQVGSESSTMLISSTSLLNWPIAPASLTSP